MKTELDRTSQQNLSKPTTTNEYFIDGLKSNVKAKKNTIVRCISSASLNESRSKENL